MSLDPNASGGGAQGSGGTDENENPDNLTPDQKKTVSFESYQKLLDEKKSFQKRLQELETSAKDRTEKELKEKEDFKTLAEKKDLELKETTSKLETLSKEISDSRKLRAFLNSVPGKVDEQYWRLIDLEDIKTDADGMPDDTSVKAAVKEFEKLFPEVIKTEGGGARMPNNPGRNPGSSALTYAEWQKLPADEMRKRQKDVVD